MSLEIRPATEDDLDAIRAVGEATLPATYAFAGPGFAQDGLDRWWSDEATLRTIHETETLVAVVDGHVVGIGNLDLRLDPPVIWKLYVLPAQHGAGAGPALMQGLLDVAVAAERDAVHLEYIHGNERATAFYRRQGFTELRREPPERPGWPETVWVEWRAQTST